MRTLPPHTLVLEICGVSSSFSSSKLLLFDKVDKSSSSSRLPERDHVLGDTAGLRSKFSLEVFSETESSESGVAERERPLDPPL